jgi:hypothetical protein
MPDESGRHACSESGTLASAGIHNLNVAGITPTTDTGAPFIRIRRPMIDGSPP